MPVLTALFDLNGTATRKQALRVFLVLLASLGAGAALASVAPAFGRFAAPILGLVYVWWWATLVRRLHDAGRSGVWAVLLLVPVLGLVASVVGLALRQGRPFNDSVAGLRLAGTLGLVAVAVLALSRLFWVPYAIPSESMKPALLVGDYAVVRHVGAGGLRRGDVVVFRHPVHPHQMVMRLIGLPGDTVQMQAGQVILNGATLSQATAGSFKEPFQPQGASKSLPRCRNAVVGVGGVCEKTLLREAQPDGRSYLVADIEASGPFDDTTLFTIPEGQMFFLGDNRDNAVDSRIAQGAGGLGFVPVENVVGRVTRTLFSSSGPSLWTVWTWRGDRIFKAVE